jgi:hypothetical protein
MASDLVEHVEILRDIDNLTQPLRILLQPGRKFHIISPVRRYGLKSTVRVAENQQYQYWY